MAIPNIHKESLTLAIVTNARAADQHSMIGYGELLLETARKTNFEVIELRPSSFFGELLPIHITGVSRKLANNLDRFVLTPFKFLGKRVDIVHVVDPGNAVYLPLIRHRCSIVTVHDMIPYLARDGKLSGFAPTRTGRWLMNRITTRLAKVNHIVCVSKATKSDLLDYVDIPDERTSVIYNAVFQPMKPASPETCATYRKTNKLPTDSPVILHVGQGFYKNRETVLEVAAQVRKNRPDMRLVMVGNLNRPLLAQVERLGLEDIVHVLRRVAREDMAALYTTASVLLFPSLYEGFGLPVLEAQMCGTPVVCSNKGSLPEVAKSAEQTFCISDPVRMTEAILDFLGKAQEGQPNIDMVGIVNTDYTRATWDISYRKLYEAKCSTC